MKNNILLLLISCMFQSCDLFRKDINPYENEDRITTKMAGTWQMKKYIVGNKDSTYCLRTQIWDGTITCHSVKWAMSKGNDITYGVIYQGLEGLGSELYDYDNKTDGMRFSPLTDEYRDTAILCSDKVSKALYLPVKIASPFGDNRVWSIYKPTSDSLILISADTTPQREIYLKLKK